MDTRYASYGGKILTVGGNALSISPDYNPLNLPSKTIRLKYSPGTSPTVHPGATATRVSSSQNVWDVSNGSSSNWSYLLNTEPRNDGLIEVLGANSYNITKMNGMFNNCKNLTKVALFDMSRVTEASAMFDGCTLLTDVPLFDLSSVTDMSGMFFGCKALTSIPWFNTSSATNMANIFASCSGLTSVPRFDTRNVTNTSDMFAYCTALTSVPLLDTRSAITMFRMFDHCTSLTSVPLLNTSSAADLSGFCWGCTSLTSIPLFDTNPPYSRGVEVDHMFDGCTNVESGALAMYQQMSSQATLPSVYNDCFTNCGASTSSGAAELAQIPSAWGGTGS